MSTDQSNARAPMSSGVAIYTMTRDRLEQTKRTFESMRTTRPGHKYDHWVFDQGSKDKTVPWLHDMHEAGRLHTVRKWPENRGLHVGMNAIHDELLAAGYDYIMKVDNDIEFKTKHWLKKLLRVQRDMGCNTVLSPRVLGLKHPPEIFARKRVDKSTVLFLDIIGGATRLMTADMLSRFRFNERMPLAWGGDATFANHCAKNTIAMCYVDEVKVRHMMDDDTQREAMPKYMERREYEAYIPYGI